MKEQTEILNNIEAMLLNNKTIFNLQDVCRYTGLSSSFIYKGTANKSIPHYKPSAKILVFRREEIDEWLLRNQVTAVDDIEQLAIDYVTKDAWNGGRHE